MAEQVKKLLEKLEELPADLADKASTRAIGYIDGLLEGGAADGNTSGGGKGSEDEPGSEQ